MRTYARLVEDRLQQHGGRRVRFEGDSFLAAFASAVNAVNCAADIQRGLEHHNRLHPAQPIRVRIGLNCGEAIREHGDFYGAAVNAAARICAQAAGGHVLVSGLVKDLVGSLSKVAFLDRGEHALKGFDRPWHLYEVIQQERNSIAATVMNTLAQRTPFVGREVELARIKGLIEGALEGQGAMATLAGEPGVGKSRLAEEVAAYAADRGFTVLTGHCYDSGGAPAYAPFIDGLERLAGRTSRPALRKMLGEEAAWVAKVIPALKEKLPDLPPAPPLPADQERHVLLNSVVGFIVQASHRKPLLWILEDLHWSDTSTQLLLRHLSRVIAEQRIVVVATFRHIEIDAAHPLTATLTELHRQRFYNNLPVVPFGPDGVRLMLVALAQEEPPAPLAEAIYRESEGNPLFVEELIKLLLEEERLFDTAGNWRTDLSARTVKLPTGVSLVIERRLLRLSALSRQTLTTAAVIGREFRYDLLQAAGDLQPEALLDAVDEAVRAHLIQGRDVRGSVEFTFAHELIWQSLYGELSPPRRQRLHLRVAEALERAYAPRESQHAAELAYHYGRAGSAADPRKTFGYLVCAGDQAMAASAFEAALHCYEEAGPLASDGAGEQADWLFKLGAAQQSTRRWDDAVRSLEAAAAAYQAGGASEGAERSFYVLTLVHGWRGRFAETLQAVERGLAVAPDSGSEPRCRILALAGKWLLFAGQLALAEQCIEQALTLAEQRGDAGLLGNVLATKGGNEWIYTRFQEAYASLSRAEHLLRTAGDRSGLLLCHADELVALGYLGRHAEMESPAHALLELAEKLGDPGGLAIHALFRSALAFVRGELAAAAAWAHSAEDTARAAAAVVLPSVLQLLAEIECATGQWQRAEALLDEAATINEQMGNPPARYVGRLAQLSARAFRGDHEGARRLLSELPKAEPPGQPLSVAAYDRMVTAAEALVLLGAREEAAAFYPTLAAMAERGVVYASVSYPLLHRILGMVAALNHRWEHALHHFETAVRQAAAARKERAHTAYWYAHMLLDRGQHDDRTRARDLLHGATQDYEGMGMPRHVEKVQELMAEANLSS